MAATAMRTTDEANPMAREEWFPMTRTTATRWAYGFLIASLLLAAAPGRVAKAQPPGYPIGGVGSHGWIDGFGMFTRTAWIGQAPVVQITGITPGAPAARFGLEVGDCIVRVNSYRTTTPRDLDYIISRSFGPLRLVVRDVRTGRLVLLDVDFRRL
jgi:S1-C subfamily serine protease